MARIFQLPLMIILLLAAFSAGAQTQPNFTEKIQQNFQNLFDRSPQEKVYLHLDKSTYTTGDNIWFKAYVTDATYHVPNLLSKFIYVEIVSREDSIKKQVKVKLIDSCFYGNIMLPMNIPGGDYCIRAYSNWMQNNDEDFFFKKNIKIVNPSEDVNVNTVHATDSGSGTITATFVNKSGKPYTGRRVKIVLRDKKKNVNEIVKQTDDGGNVTIGYATSDSIKYLDFSFQHDIPVKFNYTCYLPDFSPDFDLQFFPEGGHLLSGTSQTVAFKAININGLSTEIEGKIIDRQGTAVAPFRTTHRGMGIVTFNTKPGEEYYAIAKAENGYEKKIKLPALSEHGFAIRLLQNKDNISLSVNKSISSPSGKHFYIIIHNRGQLTDIITADENYQGEFNTNQFLPGITHFVLLGDNGKIYSERLLFTFPQQSGRLQLITDKEKYDRREYVDLRLQLRKADGTPGQGNFSISVTDNNMAAIDTNANNIVSYFLLTSDLKGHIEAPGSYSKESGEHIDLLMLTHGWTRFNIGDMLKTPATPTEYKLELTQELSGYITNYGDKVQPNAAIQMFSPSLNIFGSGNTDKDGKFLIRDLDFPDSTVFMLRGYKAKGGNMVDLHITLPGYKKPQTFFPETFLQKPASRDEFLDRFKGDYYYENGVKIYILDELQVIRHRNKKETQKYTGEYTTMADRILGQDELKNFNASTMDMLLMRLPGVVVNSGRSPIIVKTGSSPLFIVDGTPDDYDFVRGMSPTDVDNIGIITGAAASFFGSEGGNGIIIINTKSGTVDYRKTNGLIRYTPLGYLKADAFYMPGYGQPEIKNSPEIDYRSTVYWNPNVTTDSTGQASIPFFTADMNAVYTITVEGITPDGEVLYQTKNIRRE